MEKLEFSYTKKQTVILYASLKDQTYLNTHTHTHKHACTNTHTNTGKYSTYNKKLDVRKGYSSKCQHFVTSGEHMLRCDILDFCSQSCGFTALAFLPRGRCWPLILRPWSFKKVWGNAWEKARALTRVVLTTEDLGHSLKTLEFVYLYEKHR